MRRRSSLMRRFFAVRLPRQGDLELGLALAGDDPEVAVAAQSGAELHLDLGRPLFERADRFFQHAHEFAERRKRLLEQAARRFDQFVLEADLVQASALRRPEKQLLSAWQCDYHRLGHGRSPLAMLKESLV